MSGATLQKGTWTSKNIKFFLKKWIRFSISHFIYWSIMKENQFWWKKQKNATWWFFWQVIKITFRSSGWELLLQKFSEGATGCKDTNSKRTANVVSVVFQRLVGWVTTCDQLTTCSKGTDIVFTNKNKLLNKTNKKSMMIVRIRGARIGVAIRIILTMIINTMTYTYLSNYGRHLTAIGSIIWNVWENLYNPTHPLEDFSHEYPLNHP